VSPSSQTDDGNVVKNVLPAVVQVVALRKGFLGNMSVAWTGSGTIVDPSGVVLTNCHVANPRAMGMPAPPANALAISVIERSDEAPALTYLAEIAAQEPKLDLAVLRIVGRLDGRSLGRLELPHLPVGDSDELELGDSLSIFGFPGIGGQTVTFTAGSVAGFNKQQGVNARRAWVKTDATISGGNSGGTAVDTQGRLVGVPTQAAAGTGIQPVDARPVVDTNRDGRVDQRDTPMSIGGFINGLRPVNLAKPLLREAGVGQPVAGRAKSAVARRKAARAMSDDAGDSPFSMMLFCTRITQDGRPIDPADVLPSGATSIFATFEFEDMKNGAAFTQVWALDGKKIVETTEKWDDGKEGRKAIKLSKAKGLPDGEYHLVMAVGGTVVGEGKVHVGRRREDSDTQIAGTIVDDASGRGIAGVKILVLKPGVAVNDFVQKQDRAMVASMAETGRDGSFSLPEQLPKGAAYGMLVVAEGWRNLMVDGALRLDARAPEKAQLGPIRLQRD
jgi:S1-C subfamily serine protease